MRYSKVTIVWLLCFVISGVLLYPDIGYARRVNSSKEIQLTQDQQRLKDILDDANIAEIEDKKLLVGGKLDVLISMDAKYKELYKQKAKIGILNMYDEVTSEASERMRFPRNFWNGEQGLVNAAIIIRNFISIDESFVQRIPQGGWASWLRTLKLDRPIILFDVNNLIKEAVYPEIYDPANPEKPYFFHEWDILRINWDSSSGRRLIREAVKCILEREMKLVLDESFIGKVVNWHNWAHENNLSGMLASQFEDSGRAMLKFVYPEKFYPNEGHVWHDWDFQINDWDTKEGDKIAKDWIRHKIQDSVHGEGWAIDKELSNRVVSWRAWAESDVKFNSMIQTKFGSILPALKFGLAEEFEQGIIKLSDFKFQYGKGVAELESPLKTLQKDTSGAVRVSIGRVTYGFGVNYVGYYVNKIAEDLGGLWKEENGACILVNVFPLLDASFVNYAKATELLRPVPDEYKSYLTQLGNGIELSIPEDEALASLRDEFGIDIQSLGIGERIALIVLLNKDKQMLEEYLSTTDSFGVTILGNLSNPGIALSLAGSFDKWRIVFTQYQDIYNRIEDLSKAFGLGAEAIRSGSIDPTQIPEIGKYAPILLRGAVQSEIKHMNNMIIEKIYDVLRNTSMRESEKRGKIRELITAQEKLLLLTQVLQEFQNGESENFIQTKQDSYDDGTKQFFFNVKIGDIQKQVRLVNRPVESERGDAGISFSIDSYSDEEIGFRIELGYDNNLRRNVVHINIDLQKFTSLLEHFLPLAKEHELRLADPEIFSWLVKMIWQ